MADTVHTYRNLANGVPLGSGTNASLTVKAKKNVAVYDAVGGPIKPFDVGTPQAGGKTEPGHFVIVGIWKHRSKSNKWAYQEIEWGTPVRDDGRHVWVTIDSHEIDQETLTRISRDILLNDYNNYYNLSGTSATILPRTWIYNPFGHITCYFAKDLNENGYYDPDSEKIHHQFFHPTAENEAETTYGRRVVLKSSHGCIHVKPKDIDEMIQKGFMKIGNRVFISNYDETGDISIASNLKPPYSLHFFPGQKILSVRGF